VFERKGRRGEQVFSHNGKKNCQIFPRRGLKPEQTYQNGSDRGKGSTTISERRKDGGGPGEKTEGASNQKRDFGGETNTNRRKGGGNRKGKKCERNITGQSEGKMPTLCSDAGREKNLFGAAKEERKKGSGN